MKFPLKLLLNAEPFGFGPTAAIADFFPYFREKFEHVAFIGGDHCLDLQKNLPYDAFYDITNKTATGNSFKSIVSNYDVFFTACNFRRALIAHALNIPSIIYDPLAWYWKSIPDIVGTEIFYIAQDFFGVKEKFASEPKRYMNTKITTAIIPQRVELKNRDLIVVNLGGVQNPVWKTDISIEYTRRMLEMLRKNLPLKDEIIIASSVKVAEHLGDLGVATYPREQMKEYLSRAKYAIMTPGLSNIYDAAVYNIPTLFLPPANDSQGQQAKLLQENLMCDEFIDWPQLCQSKVIDYQKSQTEVLEDIFAAILSLKDPKTQKIFADLSNTALQNLMLTRSSKTTQLLDRFGRGGAEMVVESVCSYIEKTLRVCPVWVRK